MQSASQRTLLLPIFLPFSLNYYINGLYFELLRELLLNGWYHNRCIVSDELMTKHILKSCVKSFL